jgi:hypothetical protein
MATKKTTAKKPTARKSAAKKSTAKKSTPKKSTSKKIAPKKPSTKKSVGGLSIPTTLNIGHSTLTFLTESLPAFRVRKMAKTRIQAVGGKTPYSFGLSQGSTLPAGLHLNYQGTLYGTPTQAGDTTIFVKVIDFVGAHLTQAFDLQVT